MKIEWKTLNRTSTWIGCTGVVLFICEFHFLLLLLLYVMLFVFGFPYPLHCLLFACISRDLCLLPVVLDNCCSSFFEIIDEWSKVILYTFQLPTIIINEFLNGHDFHFCKNYSSLCSPCYFFCSICTFSC